MSQDVQTMIVAVGGDGDLAMRCLLELEQRYVLPPSVTVRHGAAERAIADRRAADCRILAVVTDRRDLDATFLGLLRDAEARAAVAPICNIAGIEQASRLAAVVVAGGREHPLDDAVNLAVTTLIDWGHEVVAR